MHTHANACNDRSSRRCTISRSSSSDRIENGEFSTGAVAAADDDDERSNDDDDDDDDVADMEDSDEEKDPDGSESVLGAALRVVRGMKQYSLLWTVARCVSRGGEPSARSDHETLFLGASGSRGPVRRILCGWI